MPKISGETISLIPQVEGAADAFGEPTITDGTPISVENVLISPVTSSEVLDTLNLSGRKAVCQLAIPKGDTHDWEDQTVSFWGHRWRTVGFVTQSMDHLTPLSWNKKVMVERYD